MPCWCRPELRPRHGRLSVDGRPDSPEAAIQTEQAPMLRIPNCPLGIFDKMPMAGYTASTMCSTGSYVFHGSRLQHGFPPVCIGLGNASS